MEIVQLKGGQWTTDPRLDRVLEFDAASRDYQVRHALETIGVDQFGPRDQIWTPACTLDQLKEGACVGCGCTHRRGGAPVLHEDISIELALTLYRRARQLDQWAGEEYSGTSVLAGCKAMAEAGWITEYRWIGAGSGRAIDDVVETLGHIGGIIFGLPWVPSMFEPRPSGLLEVADLDKGTAGGHCVHGFGILLGHVLAGEAGPLDLVVVQNSWGEDWGIAGHGAAGGVCYLRLEDLERLLELFGEGAVVIEPELAAKLALAA